MAKEDVIKEIVKICCEIGADTPLMLTMAEIESTFGTDPNTNVGTYIGIYQIGKTYIEDYNQI